VVAKQISPVGIIIDKETDRNPDWREGTLVRCLDTGKEYQLFDREFIRTFPLPGTKSGRVTTDANGIAEIIFGTAWKDNNYSVSLSCIDPGQGMGVIAYKYDRFNTGFKIITRGTVSGLLKPNIEVSWCATRDFNE
jgi:hypothetical protein